MAHAAQQQSGDICMLPVLQNMQPSMMTPRSSVTVLRNMLRWDSGAERTSGPDGYAYRQSICSHVARDVLHVYPCSPRFVAGECKH